MITKLKNFDWNSVLSGTLLVTVSLFVANFFGYLLQISLGRLLSVSQYGEFGSLLALSNIFGVPIAAVSVSVIKLTSELKAQERYDILTQLFKRLFFILFAVGILSMFILGFFKPQISTYLKISDPNSLFAFSLYFAVAFFAGMPSAYLQGLSRFKAFSFLTVFGSITRFLLPVLLVYLGYQVVGSYIGISSSMVLSFAAGVVLLQKNFKAGAGGDLKPYMKRLNHLAFASFFIGLGMTLLNNVDVVLVKHYFDETSAGLYTAIVTVGKVLLFGCTTVAVVMFPQVSEAYIKGEDYLAKFRYFLSLQLLVLVVGLGFFITFPKAITIFLFGESFKQASVLVPLFSIFIGLYIMINFLSMFFLAINRSRIYTFLIAGVVAQYLFTVLKHQSLEQVITINIFVSLIVVVAMVFYYYLTVRSKVHESL